MSPLEGAREAMREITGAVLASSLVLLAVFVPVAFFPGTTGQLYKQFALTIACSITISLFCALTLTPVLSSLLLGRAQRKESRFFRPVNKRHQRDARRLSPRAAVRHAAPLAHARRVRDPARRHGVGLHDDADRVHPGRRPRLRDRQLAAARRRLDRLHPPRPAQRSSSCCSQQPEISDVFDAAGFSFTGSGSNKATMFIRLKPWGERPGKEHVLSALVARMNGHFFGDFKFRHPDLLAFMVQPPSMPGLGFQSGFSLRARGPREPGDPRARRRVGDADRSGVRTRIRRSPASTRRSAPTSRRSSPTSTAPRRRSSASRCRRCSARCRCISARST